MRVLHLIKTSIGASWGLRQTKELVALGLEVHVALPSGPMVEKYQQAGVITHEISYSISPSQIWKSIKSLRKLVLKLSPDVIHSHFVITSLLMRLSLRDIKIPRIFHVPGPLHLEFWFFRFSEIILAQKSDYWLASCLWTRDRYVKSGIQKNRIGLAYYGVDASSFEKTNTQTISNVRDMLALPLSSKLIVMVAYFYPPKLYLCQTRGLKGHEDLIDAMSEVVKVDKDVHCVFIGGPWGDAEKYVNKVHHYAHEQCPNNTHFLGFRSDVASLYPQFDLAVHPSHSENVGGAVESMYANVATLTSDVGGFPDLVIDGETGYMSPAKSPKKLADKIIEALSNDEERERRIKTAGKKVRQVMDVKRNAVEILKFYQHVIKEHSL